MRILFIGDIIGKPGRKFLAENLADFKENKAIDFTIANAENLAGGFGVSEKSLNAVYQTGVDFCTSGNHIWDRREAIEIITNDQNLLRPANYPEGVPGRGYTTVEVGDISVSIINLSGTVFMQPFDNPFHLVDRILKEIREEARIKIIDFHAEATSEKIAFGRYVEGRVTAVLGTHTHVQTADETVLRGGTAYITDVGMTGSHDSVIGVEKEDVIQRFLTYMPARFSPASEDMRMSYVIVDADPNTGTATSIERGQLRD